MLNRNLNAFIDLVKDQLPEITYYSDEATDSTYHVPDARLATPGSWTHEFVQRGMIAAPAKGGSYRELERTMAALYGLHLMRGEEYEEFVAPQRRANQMVLSRESFYDMAAVVNQTLSENEDYPAILNSLIVKSDLGKTPRLKKLARDAGLNPAMDNDDLMVEILKLPDDQLNTILPSFALPNHTPAIKATIKKIYPIMTACFGHIFFLENGQETFRIIARGLTALPEDEGNDALNLVFLAQFFDGVGSQGQVAMRGSLTCNENFYQGYRLMFKMLHELNLQLLEGAELESAVQTVFNQYIFTRGSMMGVFPHDAPGDEETYQVVVRIGCMLRGFTPAFGMMLKSEFGKLSMHQKIILAEQFSFKHDGFNALPYPAHYVATVPQNISTALFGEGRNQEALALALKSMVCFAYVSRALRQQFALNDLGMKISFGELAFYADKFKGRFNEPEKLAQVFQFSPWRGKIMPLLPRPHKVGHINTLIFDLGKVFIDIDVTRKPVFDAFAVLAGKSAAEVEGIFDANRVITDDYHRGKMSSDDFRARFKAALGIPLVDDGQFFAAWTASITGNAGIVAERLAYLEGLRKLGYKIYLLSNNNDIHLEHTALNYDAANWHKYFDGQYYSNRTGHYKPDHAAFDEVVRENSLTPARTIFFDDMEVNVEAARNYGLRAELFTVANEMQELEQIIAIANLQNTIVRGTSVGSSLMLWKQRAVVANARVVVADLEEKPGHTRKLSS
jgi:FMN phosphatase YigB (HAD superfamily)